MKMINYKNFPHIVLLMIFTTVSLFLTDKSQAQTTSGTEFIFSVVPNATDVHRLHLLITSDYPTTGVIEYPLQYWSGSTIAQRSEYINFSVSPGVPTVIKVPALIFPVGVVSKVGIKVTSSHPISLFGMNQEQFTADAMLIFPVAALGREYFAITYGGGASGAPSIVVIVGTQDNTEVRIRSDVDTTSALAGVEQVITLNAMETFQLTATNIQDLTGTKILANAPVSVLSGTKCSQIPVNVRSCDHIADMMPPTDQWGKTFITYPLAKRTKGDLIRVLSATDNNIVTINGIVVANLASGDYYDVISPSANYINTTKPALVAQYPLGNEYEVILRNHYDPSIMIVPPIDQFLDRYTFVVPNFGFASHHLNLVIPASALDSLRINDEIVDLQLFQPIAGSTYVAAQLNIGPGAYVASAELPFGVLSYGLNSAESYAFPAGMGTRTLNAAMDYQNLHIHSHLATNGIDIDLTSFSIQPESIEKHGDETIIHWFFPEFSIGQVKNLDFEVIAKDLLPGETRIVTSSLEMTYQDLNGVEHKRVLGEQVLEVRSSGFALEVSTDKNIYAANETVRISTDVSNVSDIQTVVAVLSEIRDENDSLVANVATPPAFVLAGKSTLQLTPTEFLTGSTYAGSYRVYSKLVDAQGKLLAEASSAFSIAEQQAITASISATADKYSYTVKDTAVIDAFVKNLTTNKFVEDVIARVRVLAPNNSVSWNQSTPIAQIAVGNDELVRGQVPLAGAIPGVYTLEASLINTDGQVVASHLSNFTVVDSPLFVIEGHVSAGATEIGTGEVPSCIYTINNIGSTLIPEQKISVNLVRVDESDALLVQEQTIRLDAGASATLSPELPAIQQAGSYACVLEAFSDGATKMLGSALFTVVVKESPIKLTGDLVLGEKARLLVLIDASTTERTYLENLLTNAGWFYTIVDNAAAFKMELTQGGYGVYALLSEKVTLDQATQNLLNTNVAAGDGLIVAGATDRRHQSLEQALGIKARANEAYAKGIAVQESALGYPWERAFKKSARVLNFSANGATVIGEYRNNLPGAPDAPTSVGPLGAAGRYGNFVWDNFTSLSSTVEGRVAVGGNLSLQNFSVGDKLDPNKLHDVVTVGGNVTFPSGRIYYGNLIAGGTVSGVGDPVRFGMAQGAVIRGNSALDINFTGEREYLQELSTKLATLPANGTVKMQWGGMELKGDCTSTSQVFNVNGADLGVAHTFAVSCIPAGATVVFNVSGTNVTIRSMGMQSLTALRNKVLFNFPQAASLKMTSVGIEGSILAPFAQVDQPAGRIDGQVIVKSWYSTTNGYMSIHNRFFGGDLSAVASQISKNALAIYQYQQGKSVFAGFDVLAQATAFGVNGDNPFAQLLLSALEQVNPAPITARAGKVVPVIVAYENTGAQIATGQVKLSLTGAITLINSATFTQVANSSDWVLPLNLNAGVSNSQTVYVKLPASGASSIKLQLQTGATPDWETRFEKALNLNVQ